MDARDCRMIERFLKPEAEDSTMTECKAGDRLLVESDRVGRPGRAGEVLEVLTGTAGIHYRVRWDDGHETTFFPSGASVTITGVAAAEEKSRRSARGVRN